MRQNSSVVADMIPLTVDLDAIREEEPTHKGWTEEGWAKAQADSITASVFYIWSTMEYIQAIGWVDHTNDWDWWIEVKGRHGETHYHDCGSMFNGMVDQSGKLWSQWNNPTEMPFHNTDGVQLTAVSINANEEHGERDYIHRLEDISSITIGWER